MIIIIGPLGAAVVPHPGTLPRLKSSSYRKLNARIIRNLIYFDVTYYLLLLGTDVGKFIRNRLFGVTSEKIVVHGHKAHVLQ